MNNSENWLIFLITLTIYSYIVNCQLAYPPYRPSKSLFLMMNFIDLLRSIVIPLLFFTLDLTFSHLAHTPFLQTLAVFTLITFLQPFFSFSLPFSLFLLTLFSCISTGLALPYPALIGGIIFLARTASLYTTHHFLLCVGTTLLFTFSSFSILGVPFSPFYTISSITGNLIALYFSLKWFSAVKRGNRS